MEILIKIDNQQVSVAQPPVTPSDAKPQITVADGGGIPQHLQMMAGLDKTETAVDTAKKVAVENVGGPSSALLFSINGAA
jgi:hypothetical protein